MKKEELIALGIAEDVADKVFALHGKDITKIQTNLDTTKTEVETFKTQLTEANKQIENFKGLNIDQIKASADEYKTKFEKAQTDATKQVADLKFNYALDSALTGAKAKNVKAVTALLSRDALKLNDDGSILGLNEQLEAIKKDNDYLFTDAQPVPKIVSGGNNQSVMTDAFEAAMWKGAGIKPPEQKG